MKRIEIDFSRFEDAKAVHAYLKKELEFPEYYGGNLDALHDVMTDIHEDLTVVIVSAGKSFEAGFTAVLRDAAEESRHLFLKRPPRSRKNGRNHRKIS